MAQPLRGTSFFFLIVLSSLYLVYGTTTPGPSFPYCWAYTAATTSPFTLQIYGNAMSCIANPNASPCCPACPLDPTSATAACAKLWDASSVGTLITPQSTNSNGVWSFTCRVSYSGTTLTFPLTGPVPGTDYTANCLTAAASPPPPSPPPPPPPFPPPRLSPPPLPPPSSSQPPSSSSSFPPTTPTPTLTPTPTPMPTPTPSATFTASSASFFGPAAGLAAATTLAIIVF